MVEHVLKNFLSTEVERAFPAKVVGQYGIMKVEVSISFRAFHL